MKKVKILSILGVMLAMGLTACGGASSEPAPASSEEPPVQSSEEPASSSQEEKSSSQQQTTSEAPQPQKDQTGHIWGAETDVAGDTEAGTVAYKRAECTEGDGAVKFAVNQSVVTYEKGGRKSGTPDGYTKLNANGDIMSIKFNAPKYLKGKMYLYGCMDGWGSNSGKKAFLDSSGKINVAISVNGEELDISKLSDVVYTDFLSGDASDYSDDGYGYVGDIVLVPGVNYVTYKRLASMNTLVKDFVFVGEEVDSEWAEGQAVAAADGNIAYTKFASNLYADTFKLEWKALDGTFADGSSNKSGTPDGYLKLNKNGNSISYAFNFDADLDGQLYQRGAMDNYSSNQTRTYYSQQSGAKYGNFSAVLNGSNVYFGDRAAVTYLDLLGSGSNPDTTNMSGYSEVKDCLIGVGYIKNGANTMVFSRLDSFNLAVSHFVFIGKKAAAHTAPAETVEFTGKDEISHWKVVENDAFMFDRADHQWAADESNPDVASTCTAKGAKHYKCSVCGATKTEELPLAEHQWVADDSKEDVVATTCDGHGIHYEKCANCTATREVETPSPVAHTWVEGTAVQNSDSKDVIPMTCSVCNKVGAKMSENDYSSMEGSDTTPDALRPSQGKPITYKIVVSKAGKFSLEFGMFCKSNGNVKMSSRGFKVQVNGADAVVTIDGDATPDSLGMTSSNAVQLELCSEITLAEGENTIAITCAGYRLHYKGNLVVMEK